MQIRLRKRRDRRVGSDLPRLVRFLVLLMLAAAFAWLVAWARVASSLSPTSPDGGDGGDASALHVRRGSLGPAGKKRVPSALTPIQPRLTAGHGEHKITDRILQLIPKGTTFVEMGANDGRNSNTHLLEQLGWRGRR